MSKKSLYERLGGYDAISAVATIWWTACKKIRNWAGSGGIAARTA